MRMMRSAIRPIYAALAVVLLAACGTSRSTGASADGTPQQSSVPATAQTNGSSGTVQLESPETNGVYDCGNYGGNGFTQYLRFSADGRLATATSSGSADDVRSWLGNPGRPASELGTY